MGIRFRQKYPEPRPTLLDWFMRLIMMGTGSFAVPTFRGLYDTHHEVVALVTAPVRTHRGKRVAAVSEIRDVAHQHSTPIFDPENINTAQSQAALAEYQPDIMVVCDYGQILSADTLALSRLGGINLHGSLLPKYRGAAPVNWAIYRGDTTSGVTVIHMTPKVDAGPCIAQAHSPIEADETAIELEDRLADMGAWLIRRSIDSVEAGRLEALPQDPALASKAPRLKKSDGAIDWNRTAVEIRNQIRAFEPWPRTYTFWYPDLGKPARLILGPLEVIDQVELAVQSAPAGTVLEAAGDRLVIATGEGAALLKIIQPAGKRPMPAAEFLRGHKVQPADRFGPEK
jgi:methionyl-tRNA formyltransferase